MRCKIGHVTPRILAPTRPFQATVWWFSVQVSASKSPMGESSSSVSVASCKCKYASYHTSLQGRRKCTLLVPTPSTSGAGGLLLVRAVTRGAVIKGSYTFSRSAIFVQGGARRLTPQCYNPRRVKSASTEEGVGYCWSLGLHVGPRSSFFLLCYSRA